MDGTSIDFEQTMQSCKAWLAHWSDECQADPTQKRIFDQLKPMESHARDPIGVQSAGNVTR